MEKIGSGRQQPQQQFQNYPQQQTNQQYNQYGQQGNYKTSGSMMEE